MDGHIRMTFESSSTTRAAAEVLSYLAHKIYLANYADSLKPSQWVALRYFSKTNPSASTLTAFADQIGCTKGTASRTVQHLIRRGFLQRTENPKDARSSLLALTPAGKTVLENDPIHELEKQLSRLGADDQRLLQDLLIRLMKPAPKAD